GRTGARPWRRWQAAALWWAGAWLRHGATRCAGGRTPARGSHRNLPPPDTQNAPCGALRISGGERGIRTPEALFRRLHTFQACSFNHSDTSPGGPAGEGCDVPRTRAIGAAALHNGRMSYLVLDRKWRPGRFAELVGQEHVVRALSNALESGRVHHAYLFTGTRGVGKTTIARIFA